MVNSVVFNFANFILNDPLIVLFSFLEIATLQDGLSRYFFEKEMYPILLSHLRTSLAEYPWISSQPASLEEDHLTIEH